MTDQKYMRPGLPFAIGKAVEEAGEFLAAMGKTMRLHRRQPRTAVWLRRKISDFRGALDNLERKMTNEEIGRLPSRNTYTVRPMGAAEYRDAVAAEIATLTGCTLSQAVNMTGSPADMADTVADEMSVEDYAGEILYAETT